MKNQISFVFMQWILPLSKNEGQIFTSNLNSWFYIFLASHIVFDQEKKYITNTQTRHVGQNIVQIRIRSLGIVCLILWARHLFYFRQLNLALFEVVNFMKSQKQGSWIKKDPKQFMELVCSFVIIPWCSWMKTCPFQFLNFFLIFLNDLS